MTALDPGNRQRVIRSLVSRATGYRTLMDADLDARAEVDFDDRQVIFRENLGELELAMQALRAAALICEPFSRTDDNT